MFGKTSKRVCIYWGQLLCAAQAGTRILSICSPSPANTSSYL